MHSIKLGKNLRFSVILVYLVRSFLFDFTLFITIKHITSLFLNVSDEGSCLSKAILTISFHSGGGPTLKKYCHGGQMASIALIELYPSV